jgi:hypothetical protein
LGRFAPGEPKIETVPHTDTAESESRSAAPIFTATLASTTIIDEDRHYRAIPGYGIARHLRNLVAQAVGTTRS